MNATAKLIDHYGSVNAAQAKWLKANSYDGVIVYLGYKNHKWNKAVKPSDIQVLHNEGHKIVSMWEGTAKAALGGYSQGVLDAAQAVDESTWLSQPDKSAIYFAVDFDAQPKDMSQVSDYFRSVRKSLNGKYLVGAYGSYAVIEALFDAKLIDTGMQTAAWSYGKVSSRAAIYQRDIDVSLNGMQVDIDLVYSNPGWWPVDAKPIAYPTYNVVVADKVFEAIDVNGDTHILYTALDALNVPYSLVKDSQGQYHGVMQINGHNVQCVQYNGTTYVPYTAFPTKPIKVEWYFPTK